MRLSDKGLSLIKAQEGYHTALSDGGCKAYQCPAGKWTCGWGCTEDVGPLTQWTKQEAEEHLTEEMRVHERNVEGVVKVPLTQGQFDALVSLSYNVGVGTLRKSTLLRHLNRGDYARAASHFADFKKARVTGLTAKRMKVKDNTLVVLPGLVTRRADEALLFLEAVPNDSMAQDVAAPDWKMKPLEAMLKIAAPAAGTAAVGAPYIPAVPPSVTESIVNLGAWKQALVQLGTLSNEAVISGTAGVTVAGAAYAAARKWMGGT
jgi:lysozyme